MTTRRARLRRRLRPLVKPLLGAFLALIGVLAPIESPDLASFDDLVGAPPASAQTLTTVVDGTPNGCPTTRNWQVDNSDPSLCVLSENACPEHPLAGQYPALAGTHLTPSIVFADFCEAPPVSESADAAMYSDCEVLKGAVIQITGTSPNRECWIIQPAKCAAQLHRIAFDKCLRVQRQTWSCGPGEFPRNQFNSCYKPSGYTGPNLACGTGAPDFPIVTCAEYVGGDYASDPADLALLDCRHAFSTGTSPALQDHTTNRHWCRYDTSYLDVECYAGSLPCQASYAYCLKRASRTGGCDMVAETLRCRALQADYRTRMVSPEDVYRQGCTPCVVLPFEALPVAECPRELSQPPLRPSQYRAIFNRAEWAHTYKNDFLETDLWCARSFHNTRVMPPPPRCQDPLPSCADPPRGRLVWDSNHHSGFAIVNSPVTLQVEGLLSQTRRLYRVLFNTSLRFALRTDSYLVYEYPGSSPGSPAIRTWHQEDTSRTYRSVPDIAQGECLLEDRPQFRVLIEELWPDNDEAAIERLFGVRALDWWGALTPQEQSRRTGARGSLVRDEIPCNYGREVWCIWTPARPGYYRLTAAGGWSLRTFTRSRSWMQSQQVWVINQFLQNHFDAGDDDCPHTDGLARGRDYDCIMEHLDLMGGVTPAQIGLVHDPVGKTFTGLETVLVHQDAEWLYSAGEDYRCPSLDVRVLCGSPHGAINYTESEPIGIQVHEVRVSTVMPNN